MTQEPEPEATLSNFFKLFLRQVSERDLFSRNQVWECFYYVWDEFSGNADGGVRKPGFEPDKAELLIGLILLSGVQSFGLLGRNGDEWIAEILESTIGMHDHPLP